MSWDWASGNSGLKRCTTTACLSPPNKLRLLLPSGYEFHSDYPVAFSPTLNFSALLKATASKWEAERVGRLQWKEQGALRMADSDGKQGLSEWRHSHWRNDWEAQEGNRCVATCVLLFVVFRRWYGRWAYSWLLSRQRSTLLQTLLDIKLMCLERLPWHINYIEYFQFVMK